MSLVTALKTMHRRDLTEDQIKSAHFFQEMFEIPDDDPLIAVLAMMGVNRILLEEQAEILQQKANATIELHALTLRNQSTVIAKELIAVVCDMVIATNIGRKQMGLWAVIFVGGVVIGGLLAHVFWH